jgi:histidinol-phosphate aminotransferase
MMKPASHIFAMPDYLQEVPQASKIWLASNENCYGPSPKVVEVIAGALTQVNRYPNEGGYLLREAIAAKHSVSISQVILGNGSSEVVELIARAFLQPQDNAITSAQTFVMYPHAIRSTGAECRQIPAKDFAYDLDAIAAAIDEHTRVIYVANPNNPTGLMIGKAILDPFVASLSSNIVVVLDEAYFDYVESDDFPQALEYVKSFPNVIVLRTFSKVHSLAGLRIGYGIGSEAVISSLNRVRAPYNVNVLAERAALAALEDEEHVRLSKEGNRHERRFLESSLDRLGVRYLPTTANFFLTILHDPSDVAAQLKQNGIVVRTTGRFNIPEGIRVTIGTHEENIAFIEALEKIVTK